MVSLDDLSWHKFFRLKKEPGEKGQEIFLKRINFLIKTTCLANKDIECYGQV